ncbi:helix-turn-helix domain-containing protein [Amycolatopsis sp. CA-230715]|uniref:helix-turn-helix domain-containing protein n=1 Tax=Amycolatopsis sp. CA-230715 TaxID=2745196 RepID=UPI001C010F41|nr:helix-turn-helix transcriptional regulator [Amycolatopsis sp. CA-230715]QWF83285.1 hypothetical protein HUW46_06725 [Amycolatopsis sp. CA-230715]
MPRNTPEGAAWTARDRVLSGALSEAYARRKKESKLNLRDLGERVGVSHATLSRWFNGQNVPGYEDVVSLVTALGIVGEEKERIVDLVRNPGPNLFSTGAAGVGQQLSGVMQLERTSSAITNWSPAVVPGLLQTRDYATAIMQHGDLPTSEIEHRVTLRMARRDAIMRADPLRLDAFVGEPALQGRVGGAEVMSEQLRHLLNMVDRFDNVTVRMMTLFGDWHPGLMGPFVVYDSHEMPPIVHLEHHASSGFLYDRKDVAAYQEAVRVLRDAAMSPDETRVMIEDQIRQWEATG